jgi:hypothetical protein
VLFDTNPFYENIDKEFIDIISLVSDKESWPTINDPEIEEIIDKLNGMSLNHVDKIKSVSPAVCLGLMAVLSLPRCIRMLQVIGNEVPEKIKEITNVSILDDEDARAYFATLMQRLQLIIRINLLGRVYSEDRRALVIKYIIEGAENDE